MKRFLTTLLLSLGASVAAQNRIPVINLVGTNPTGTSCPSSNALEQYNNTIFSCDQATGVWVPNGNGVYLPLTGGSVTGNVGVTGNVSVSGSLTLSGGDPTASTQAATKHYVDTSQRINVAYLGCSPSATAAQNQTCFDTLFAPGLQNVSVFIPAGTYHVNACESIPLSYNFTIQGPGYQAATINQDTSGTCIWKFTAENTSNFQISHLGFDYSTQQPMATSESANYPATAILFDTTARTSGGIYQFTMDHLWFNNATRGIATEKYTTGFGIPIWGAVWDDIYAFAGLNGATINLTYGTGSTGGQPRQSFYNIYNQQQLVQEPVMSSTNLDTLKAVNIEADNDTGTVLDFSETQTGSIDGLHIEQYKQEQSNSYSNEYPVVLLTNANVRINDVRIQAHLCPTGTPCNSVTNPQFWFALNNNPYGGAMSVHNIVIGTYGDDKAGAQSYVAATGATPLVLGDIDNVSGFTGCLEPGSDATKYRHLCGTDTLTTLNVTTVTSTTSNITTANITNLNVTGPVVASGSSYNIQSTLDLGVNGSKPGCVKLEPQTSTHTIFWMCNVAGTSDFVEISNGGTPGTNPIKIDGGGDLWVPGFITSFLGASTAPICPNGPNNSFTTAGCVAQALAAVPLLSGTTATTQATADTSTDVATDAFVHNAISAQLQVKVVTPCTTGTAAFSTCASTASTWGTSFADTNYSITCTGVGMTGTVTQVFITSKTTSGFVVNLQNGDSNGAVASTFSEVDCTGIHP